VTGASLTRRPSGASAIGASTRRTTSVVRPASRRVTGVVNGCSVTGIRPPGRRVAVPVSIPVRWRWPAASTVPATIRSVPTKDPAGRTAPRTGRGSGSPSSGSAAPRSGVSAPRLTTTAISTAMRCRVGMACPSVARCPPGTRPPLKSPISSTDLSKRRATPWGATGGRQPYARRRRGVQGWVVQACRFERGPHRALRIRPHVSGHPMIFSR
jgi:hypothetical protein